MSSPNSGETPKRSNVRHTRAVQHDRTQRGGGAPVEEGIEQVLRDVVHPASWSQLGILRASGMRSRVLTLPVMVGIVLTMIWRQVGSVCEMARLINREVLLWIPKIKITQQAINTRLRVMPASVFGNVFDEILPVMQERWRTRKRPLPAAIEWAQKRYEQVMICDGSVLESLIRKVGLLKDNETHPLAGRMTALLDASSRLPIWIGLTPEPMSSDQRFWPEILERTHAGALLIFDLGYTNYARFGEMTQKGVTFITRAKDNLGYEVADVLERSAAVHDQIIWVGQTREGTRQQLRLVEVLYRGKWYRYLTNELDPNRLPAEMLVNIYRERWGIESAFSIVKSLLGLSYFFCGAQNAVHLQVWATWILYAVLVDLTDAVADGLEKPFAAISMEMVYRSIQFYVTAHHRNETNDLVAFFVSEHKLLGLIKRKKPPKRVAETLTDGESP